jgi:hypothetical protein
MKAGTVAIVVAVLAGVALAATLVLRTTDALFTATTDNPSNSWATGTVVLSDDDGGVTALFNSGTDGSLTGGQVLTRCVVVRYDGTLTSGISVKLHGTAAGALAPYLDLTIDQGSGGGGVGSCTGFSLSTAGVYTGTLDGFATATAAGFTAGVGTWAPASNGATMSYRFTITVQSVAGAQGKSASGGFTWEARG